MPSRKLFWTLLHIVSTTYLFPEIAFLTILFLLYFNKYFAHTLVIEMVVINKLLFMYLVLCIVVPHFDFKFLRSKNFVFSLLYLITAARIWINFTFVIRFKISALSYILFSLFAKPYKFGYYHFHFINKKMQALRH